MPTQQELDDAAKGFVAERAYEKVTEASEGFPVAYNVSVDLSEPTNMSHEETVALQAGLDLEDHFMLAAFTAPHKVRAQMQASDSFRVVWDSGATICITNDKDDFVTPPGSPGLMTHLEGLAKGMKVTGRGIVEWTVLDVDGKPRPLRIEAYLVPSSTAKLLSTTALLRTYPEESIVLNDQYAELSGVEGDPSRRPVRVYNNPTNHLPECTSFRLKGSHKVAGELKAMTAAVDPNNTNLSEAEKEWLRWHQKCGHMDF